MKKEDATNRKSHVVANTSVAYILIDPENLTEELKERLFLNGENKYWGIALRHDDNGNYYGIWTEIKDENIAVEEISKQLTEIALSLPTLKVDKSEEAEKKLKFSMEG